MKKAPEMPFYSLSLAPETHLRETANRPMFFYSDSAEVITWDCEVWLLMLVLSLVGGYARVSEPGFGSGRVTTPWNLPEKESRLSQLCWFTFQKHFVLGFLPFSGRLLGISSHAALAISSE
jgi:hypothetical protein